jgi:hypothetical protein
MLERIKTYVIVALLLTTACYYYLYTTYAKPCPVAESQVLVQEVVKNQTVTTTRTKPDGSTTVKVVETVKEIKTQQETAQVPTQLSRYDVHAAVNPADRSDYQVGVGARLGNLPAFGTVDYRPKFNTWLLGVRVEF